MRDKVKVLDYVRQRSAADSACRYHPNELYDYLVRCLFRERLHQDDECNICFAKRGQANRTEALLKALETTRNRFAKRWGITSDAQINVIPALPAQFPGLQAADYFFMGVAALL